MTKDETYPTGSGGFFGIALSPEPYEDSLGSTAVLRLKSLRPKQVSHAGRSAFTLIELGIVVALLAIMVAWITPELKGTFEDGLLRSTSSKLISAIGLAHSQAVTQGTDQHLRFDYNESAYRIVPESMGMENAPITASGDAKSIQSHSPDSEGKWDPRIKITVRPTSTSSPGEQINDGINSTYPNDPSPSNSQEAPRQGEAGTTQKSISFRADGTSEAVSIFITDREGYSLELRINPVTSRVKLSRKPQT